MNTLKTTTISLLLLALAAGGLPAQDSSTAGWEKIRLRSGNSLQGKVIKRTDTDIFLDVGYTILRIPRASIDVITAQVESADPAARKVGNKPGPQADSIFFTRRLDAGTIE